MPIEDIHLPIVINPENLFYHINSKGFITSAYKNSAQTLPIVNTILNREKNIFNIFSMPKVQTIEEVLSISKGPFYLRNELSLEILKYLGYYTDLPFLILHIFNLHEKEYFGKISHGKYLPNINYTNNSIVLYIDNKDTLRGFNKKLIKNLDQQTKEYILNLIGKPSANLMEPTPLQIQNNYDIKAENNIKNGWKIVFNHHFCQLSDFLLDDPSITIKKGFPWIWKNDSTSLAYSSLPGTINCISHDFRFTVECTVIKGDGPLLSVSPQDLIESNPDNHTYQAGKGYNNNSFSIKQTGNFVSHQNGTLPIGKARFSLIKTDKLISLSINDKVAVKYHDPELERDLNGTCQIMIRPGTEIEIYKITLEKRESISYDSPEEEGGTLVKLKHQPEKVFLMSRFHNIAFSSTYIDIMGFVLIDVSEIEQRASLYRNRYRYEKRKNTISKEKLIGSSKTMNSIREKVDLISGTTAPVLLEGATGTGKDILARLIHEQSGRDGLFVKIDCSALSSSLIESELFGHEKGAFTGAIDKKIGRFEQAQNGTIFLDEISNISKEIQAKLLNVLQDFTIFRIGGNTPIKLDVRIIAASNIPLRSLIAQELFREDLFYRINAININLPNLATHAEDIPELCNFFIHELNHSLKKNIIGISSEAYQKLYQHNWPGNVRELKNVLQRAILFTSGDTITEEAIQIDENAKTTLNKRNVPREYYHLNNVKKEDWINFLKENFGLVSKVAALLGVTRKTCYRNFIKHNINPDDFRNNSSGG